MGKPFGAVEVGKLAVRESIREVTVNSLVCIINTFMAVDLPNDSHRGAHKGVAPVLIIEDGVQKLKDGFRIGLEEGSWN